MSVRIIGSLVLIIALITSSFRGLWPLRLQSIALSPFSGRLGTLYESPVGDGDDKDEEIFGDKSALPFVQPLSIDDLINNKNSDISKDKDNLLWSKNDKLRKYNWSVGLCK